MRGRRFRNGVKAGLVALAAACAVALLAGPASSRTAASPVFRADWRVTGVTGKRPPNIVEIRLAGKGRYTFFRSPADVVEDADNSSGVLVVEYDVLTPTPKTASLTFRVTSGRIALAALYPGAHPNDVVYASLKLVNRENTVGTVANCPLGTNGEFALFKGERQGYQLVVHDCAIDVLQRANLGSNSRVHVTIDPKCLRTVAARKPLCGSKAATFKLVRTEVKNAAPGFLTIDPAGSAKYTSPPGGAVIKTSYLWKVPSTLVTGSSAKVSVGITVSIEPSQLLAQQITVIAPDFRKDVPVNFPDHPSAVGNFTIPIAASLASSSELTITIGIDQGQVIYHYRK
jgi:hypothetical protein